jgi:hypothetical protein
MMVAKNEKGADVVSAIKDLVEAVRLLGNLVRRIYPSPLSDEVQTVVERRCAAARAAVGLE